ncbi:hypothetical protein BMS3Abin10_01559 [bacterium BMS3Abin10]|nr:hypothetical protein BMS3Abin10_01559 [bacterium BMS3Abin10]
MQPNIFKVHTDTFGRLAACIKHAMYGVSLTAMTQQMPRDLANIKTGDIVFISEREISNNALFGPFYVVDNRPTVVVKRRKGSWIEIDTEKTSHENIAYWVEFEKRSWCMLFDDTLSNRISIVWPYNWSRLNLQLPSWGAVSSNDAIKLIDFAIENEVEAREFLRSHDVWL